MTDKTPKPGKRSLRRNFMLGASMASIAVGMVGVSYAAVPLYKLFCQVTGYGGTTQRAENVPDNVLQRTITVRFDANIGRNMGWEFQPLQRKQVLKIGESSIAYYEAKNITGRKITGTSTFNVSPQAAGSYFSKVQCFCFTEQTLEPGASEKMPVTFFIDPEIVNDPEARNIREITLSYTFFPVKESAKASVGVLTPKRDGT